MLIQIPIIFGLYWVFFKGLPVVDAAQLYAFVQHPGELYMKFLSFDLLGKSIVLALLTGLTQYIQAKISMKRQPALPKSEGGKPSFQEDFARSMQVQMVYVLPVMIGAIAYHLPAAVALYWTTSNILGIGQELLVSRKLRDLAKK
jgi:YidC/Oxa1 family membrane protein insertase